VYTTYDEIKVNPTAADLSAAGLGVHNFLTATTAAEALAVVDAARSGCEFVEVSLEFNRTDLHSYKDHPWSSELDEEGFRVHAREKDIAAATAIAMQADAAVTEGDRQARHGNKQHGYDHWDVGPISLDKAYGWNNGHGKVTLSATSSACFPSVGSACGNPSLHLSASLYMAVSTDPLQCEVGGNVMIGVTCEVLGIPMGFAQYGGLMMQPDFGPRGFTLKMTLWASRKLSISVASVEAKVGVSWSPPWRIVSVRAPNGAFAEVQACLTFMCATLTIPIQLPT